MRTYLAVLFLPLLLSCAGPKEASQTHAPDQSDHEEVDARTDEARIMAVFMDAQRARIVGDVPTAMRLFEQVLKLAPRNAASMFELAKMLNQQQRMDEATAMAEKAVATDKENIWYRFLQADLYQQAGKSDKAVNVYKGIIEKWPNRLEVYMDLASTLIYLDRADEAQQVFTDLRERFGESEELTMQQYQMLASHGHLNEAKALAESLIELDPDSPQYHAMLAEVHDQMGEHDLAYEEYKLVAELDPGNSMVRIAMAEYLFEIDSLDMAVEQLSRAFDDPELSIDAKMQVLLGFYDLTQAGGEHADERTLLLGKAYQLIEKLKQVHPNDGRPFTIHGDYLLRDGRPTEAREQFKEAVKYSPDRFAIWQQLVLLDSQIADSQAMHEDAQAASELFPSLPIFHLFNGIALNQLGRHDEAVEVLVAGRDLVVDDDAMLLQFHTSLGDVYQEMGDHERSDRSMDMALELAPDDATVLNNYSYYLSLRKEKLDLAEKMSGRSNELRPGQPSFQDTYAWVLYQMGRYADARTWIEKAIASGGAGEAVLLEHYGDILFKLNDSNGALEQWEKARSIGGASEEIDRKIAEGRTLD